MSNLPEKEKYIKILCLFLAEEMRVHNIELDRAAFVARKVMQNINLLDSEKDFLSLIKELSKDFNELVRFGQHLEYSSAIKSRRNWEQFVTDYVVSNLTNNMHTALQIVEDASQPDMSLDILKKKYPEFGDYIVKISKEKNK